MSVLLSSFSVGKNALHFFYVFFFTLEIWQEEGREDMKWWSREVLGWEHWGFAKQQDEECLFVHATSRWIVVMNYWIFYEIPCHFSTCKLEFVWLSLWRAYFISIQVLFLKKKSKKKERGGEEPTLGAGAPGRLQSAAELRRPAAPSPASSYPVIGEIFGHNRLRS